MAAPPVALRREDPRRPHPKSLVPAHEVFAPDSVQLLGLPSHRKFVPPLAHRRGVPSRPVEVRVRANILSILSIDLKNQTFTCVFFLDSSWVDYGLKGTGHGVAVQSINRELTNQVRVRRLRVCAPCVRRACAGDRARCTQPFNPTPALYRRCAVLRLLRVQRQGYLITNEDPDFYYFSPQIRFRNLVAG